MTARVPSPIHARPSSAPNSLPRAGDQVPPHAETLARLPEVLRGLSAAFWGLPLALLAFARHFLVLWPTPYDLLLPTLAAALLLYGLVSLGRFHPRERIWQRSVLLSQVLALVLVGLAPFLFLWSRSPNTAFFARAVLLLVMASLLFVVAFSRTLVRLSAILPDEIARGDARLFHLLSSYVIAILVGLAATLYLRLMPIPLTEFLALPRQPFGFARQALVLLLALVPVAMTMAVSWKLKEVAFAILAGRRNLDPAG